MQRDSNHNPYPHKFHRTLRIDEFNEVFGARNIGNDVFLEEEKVSVSGRVMSLRSAGKALIFIDLHGDEQKV
jgi:lysyl-tRNA synthetase class 2